MKQKDETFHFQLRSRNELSVLSESTLQSAKPDEFEKFYTETDIESSNNEISSSVGKVQIEKTNEGSGKRKIIRNL